MTSHPGDGGPPPLPPELDPRGRRASRRRARHDVRYGVTLGTGIVAALLSAAVLVASGWAWYTWNNFKSNIKRVDAIPVSPSQKPKHDIDGKDQNILIVGNDDRSSATNAELAELGTTRDGGSLNTDTMMLLHVPADGRKATMISFPRDSYVAIPGHGMNKLNSAYPDGVAASNGNKSAGARLLVETIQNLTGLTIDHFVQVDLLGFYRISKAIGGVRVNMCAAVKEPNSGIDLPAGWSTIEGKQALAFVRQRHGLPLGDIDRVKRQQYFLAAVFRKLSSAGVLLNPIKLQNLLKAVSDSLYMDGNSPGHKGLDPLKLAEQMQDLTAGNLTFSTIPWDGFDTIEGVGDIDVVHPDQVRAWVQQQVAQTASQPSQPAHPSGPAPSSITVDVLNGANVGGTAGRNAEALRKAGFQVGTVGNAPSPIPITTVEYPSALKAQAQVVAAKVPGAQLQQTSSVQHVTLILGTDGRTVAGAGSSGGSSSGGGSSGGGSSKQPDVINAAAAAKGCIN